MDPSARCSSQNARLEPNMSSCLGVTPYASDDPSPHVIAAPNRAD
jgi:hypothetical protein